jgi:hypothetical protein
MEVYTGIVSHVRACVQLKLWGCGPVLLERTLDAAIVALHAACGGHWHGVRA